MADVKCNHQSKKDIIFDLVACGIVDSDNASEFLHMHEHEFIMDMLRLGYLLPPTECKVKGFKQQRILASVAHAQATKKRSKKKYQEINNYSRGYPITREIVEILHKIFGRLWAWTA